MTRTARPRRRPTPTVDVHPGLLRAGDRVHPDDPLLFDATARVVVHGPPERLCDPATGAVVGWKVPLAPDGTVALVVPEGRKVRTRRRGTPHTLTPEQADLLVDDYPRRP